MFKHARIRISAVGLIAAIALMCGALTLNGSTAEASHGVALDHFKCYLAQDRTPWNQVVNLADQFLPNGFQTRVGNAIRFCNPTEKTHDGVVTPIGDPNGHLTLYPLGPLPAPITRAILVTNQFTPTGAAQQWTVSGPHWLAAPTQKQGHPTPPHDLDHFLCYRASGQTVGVGTAPLTLRDEFLTETLPAGYPLTPAMFCNPARKLHNDVVTPIHHPDAHLACYTLRGQPGSRPRYVRNQFGTEQILVTNPNMLCVPSKKEVVPQPA